MAEIRPLRAFRYDPRRVSLEQVVTQPYDKITPEMQDRYYRASPYNLTRIILGRKEENDNPANNVYSRAANYFRKWREQEILREDKEPSIYLYSQRFCAPGTTASAARLERRGFVALGRIEDYSAGVVFRHEQTLAKPKADRLELLRATRAHFGQIFMLYEDDGKVEGLLHSEVQPDAIASDEYGVEHRLWAISDPNKIACIQRGLKDKRLIIADGHHRYETALNYRNERRAAESAGQNSAGGAPYEFVMMTFINMNSPGLLILPTHRVVHSLSSFSEETFRQAARSYFDVDEIDLPINGAHVTGILRECGRSGTVLLAVTARRSFLLHHPNPNAERVFDGLSLRQQDLDVVQLHKCLLENVLGLSEESIRNQQNLSYLRDPDEALAQVHNGKANIAFLMNPCRISQVRDIAFAGEVMPQKSTDFYPKLLSGLTIYAVE
jgi:uncharacterized protein (DUF1015 family)